MSDLRVGFIGIGNMGWPMAKNILKAGNNVLQADHKLHVFDLDKKRVAKFVKEEPGALGTAEAAAVAKASNVIITMLPTGPIVRDVVLDMLDKRRAGQGHDRRRHEFVGTDRHAATRGDAGESRRHPDRRAGVRRHHRRAGRHADADDRRQRRHGDRAGDAGAADHGRQSCSAPARPARATS